VPCGDHHLLLCADQKPNCSEGRVTSRVKRGGRQKTGEMAIEWFAADPQRYFLEVALSDVTCR